MHKLTVKALYDKIRLKYSSLPYEHKNRVAFRRIERSLNLLYPYEFIHDSKGVPNYNLKSIIFDVYKDDLNIVRKYKRALYLNDKIQHTNQFSWVIDFENKCYQIMHNDGTISVGYTFEEKAFVDRWLPLGNNLKSKAPFLYKECERIVNSEVQRRKRLRKRVSEIVSSGKSYFVTLTFNDETLNNTQSDTRRQAVSRFLNSVSNNYVGNVDFGKLNGREHYHAVISSDKLDDIKYTYDKRYGWMCKDFDQFKEWSKRGYYTIKSCGTSDQDKRKLAAYTAKLVNHAIKETTRRNALIYSR